MLSLASGLWNRWGSEYVWKNPILIKQWKLNLTFNTNITTAYKYNHFLGETELYDNKMPVQVCCCMDVSLKKHFLNLTKWISWILRIWNPVDYQLPRLIEIWLWNRSWERKLEVPCNFHSELSLPGTFVLWNFRSQECSLQELLFPETVREKVIWILQQTNYPSFFRVTCTPKHFGDINIANDARYHNIDVQKMLNRIWNVFNNIKKEPLHSDVKTRKG